jgi:hypothetical protein
VKRHSLVRLIIAALISWACGVSIISAISYFFYGELSLADFLGFAGMSLMASVFVFTVIYAPGLFWLRRRLKGCQPVILFPLASALFLNAPLFMSLGLMAGRNMMASEAILFASGFLATGFVFGLGFIWSYGEKPVSPISA